MHMESTRGIEQRRAQEPGHEHIPVTRFIIDLTNPVEAENTESGAESTIYNIGMSRKGGDASASYYGLSDLSRTEKLEIFIRSEDGTEQVALPEDMLERVAAFIREDHAREEEADCSSFVHFVNDIRYEFGQFIPEKWEISDFDEQASVPGDAVMISRDPEHADVTHFALYLGEGLYLSKFGIGGKLIATTMEAMNGMYEGNHAFLIRPRNPDVQENAEREQQIRKRIREIEMEQESLRRELDESGKRVGEPNESDSLAVIQERLDVLRGRDRINSRLSELYDEKSALMLKALLMGFVIIPDDAK